jgi:ketosteroid isomerase-like protein
VVIGRAACDAVVFHVTGGHIDAVTEYCDTSYMKRVLFDQ